MNDKIGILLPKSILYPSISFDLVNGLRAGLAAAGNTTAEVKTENIALGADDKLIYAQCEKLVFEGCKIIAGYINPASAEKLEPLLAMANITFIALDAGYHFPSTLRKFEHIFCLSLQGALCCSVSARKAVAEGVSNAAYTGSFYETGYRSVFAFYTSLEDAGGSINFNHISKLKRSEFSLEPLAEHLAKPGTDGIFASYCGDMLEDFFTAAASENLFKNYPVYGSPFIGEEEWLSKIPYPGMDVRVCVPWASGLENNENRKFTTALGRRTNVFSLLGWEAGVTINAALQADADTLPGFLEGFAFESPRGKVSLDAGTHQCHAPVYDALVKRDEATCNCRLVPGGQSPYTNEQRTKLEQAIASNTGSFTSWFNCYACLDS